MRLKPQLAARKRLQRIYKLLTAAWQILTAIATQRRQRIVGYALRKPSGPVRDLRENRVASIWVHQEVASKSAMRGGARPVIVFRSGDHAGPDGIQLHIPHGIDEIARIES